jgi:hypothetical protein
VLTKIFVPKRLSITDIWRKFNLEALNLYFSTNIIDSVEFVVRDLRHT